MINFKLRGHLNIILEIIIFCSKILRYALLISIYSKNDNLNVIYRNCVSNNDFTKIDEDDIIKLIYCLLPSMIVSSFVMVK